jgi:hypothetical protein
MKNGAQHRVCLMAGDTVAHSFSFFITFGVGGQIRWIYPPLNKPKTLAVTLLTTVLKFNRQTNERTSQRFCKIKRGAAQRTSQRTVAPHLLLPQSH